MRVAQPDYIAGAAGSNSKRLDGVFHTPRCEVLEKRIARAERKKTERGASALLCFGKKAIHNFVSGAVAAHRQKIPQAFAIRFANDSDRLSGALGPDYFDVDACITTHALQKFAGELAAAPSPGSGIYDGQETFAHRVEAFSNVNRVRII
jgi:hypothetical protein